MDLGAWILDHEVRWELRPRYERRAGRIVRAGFQLELFAAGATLAADPGSAECHALHEMLVEVARLALPPELRPIAYAPFDHAFHLAAGRDPLPEIELLVDIGPLAGTTNGDAQETLLRQVEERLRRLGVRPRGEPPVARRPARTASIPPGTGCAPDQRPLRSAEAQEPKPAGERRAEGPPSLRRVA